MFSCEHCTSFKNNFFSRRPLGTASVLRGIKRLNFNRSLENLHTMDDFSFTNFLSDRVMGDVSYCCASYCCFRKFAFGNLLAASPEGASYYCFRKAVSNTSSTKYYWQISLVLASISFKISFFSLSADRRLWKECSTKGAGHCFFRRTVLNSYFENFWKVNCISLTPNCLSTSFWLTFCWQKAMESMLYERSRLLLLSQSGLKQLLWESLTGKFQ